MPASPATSTSKPAFAAPRREPAPIGSPTRQNRQLIEIPKGMNLSFLDEFDKVRRCLKDYHQYRQTAPRLAPVMSARRLCWFYWLYITALRYKRIPVTANHASSPAALLQANAIQY
jgi:hypothetical protein